MKTNILIINKLSSYTAIAKPAARDGANTAPYPPFPASETMCLDSGTLPSGRNSSGNAFSLNRRAVRFKITCEFQVLDKIKTLDNGFH